MTNIIPDWKKCLHDWEPHETIREEMFNVGIGSRRVCKKCKAIEYENWCETRASGGTPKIYPPEDETASKSKS